MAMKMKESEKYGFKNVLSQPVRVEHRRDISEKEYLGVVSSAAEQRKKYTLNEIADHCEIWTAWDGDELPTFESSLNDVIDIWPHRLFAERLSAPNEGDWRMVPIPIDEFIDELLFSDDRAIDVALLPIGTNSEVIMMTREGFATELAQEWSRIYGPIPKQLIDNRE